MDHPTIRTLRHGEEAQEYLAHAVVGAFVFYYDVLHKVIDTQSEQGKRLAAHRFSKAKGGAL